MGKRLTKEEQLERAHPWVQNEIQRLKSDIKYWKLKALQVSGEVPTEVELNFGYGNRGYLPNRTMVEFRLNKHDTIRCMMRQNDEVEITSIYGGRLNISPSAVNVILVRGQGN